MQDISSALTEVAANVTPVCGDESSRCEKADVAGIEYCRKRMRTVHVNLLEVAAVRPCNSSCDVKLNLLMNQESCL
jgi:hypothetical protein